ncbi:MAG TPA: GTP cyclohydrolase MptA [Thermoplasmata archaeon]|nr:GTP cyclohydrolase MptA [Thermoplasmata archaeon]
MKDIHASTPAHGQLTLRSVGVTGIRKPLGVQRPDRVHTLSATFAVAVDLPSERKGSDLSRNAEVLAEIVDRTALRPVASLESACSSIARELLARHAYASRAEVEASAEYFLERGIAEGKRSLEDYAIFAEAVAAREGTGAVRVRRSIGAEAVGMTACPCAMETCRELLIAEYPRLADPSLATMPVISHNQRNRTRLVFELGEEEEVEVDEMIAAIEAAQSSPTYAILKRGDEGRVVYDAHRHPKFVEDVLRDLLASLPARFPRVPDSVVARASTSSEESIHKYNVDASHDVTFGELRRPAEG